MKCSVVLCFCERSPAGSGRPGAAAGPHRPETHVPVSVDGHQAERKQEPETQWKPKQIRRAVLQEEPGGSNEFSDAECRTTGHDTGSVQEQYSLNVSAGQFKPSVHLLTHTQIHRNIYTHTQTHTVPVFSVFVSMERQL